MPEDRFPLSMGINPTLDILFEDKAIILVNKPAGQLFQGHTQGLPDPLDTQVKSHIRLHKPGSPNVYLGIVHRLDRPVSGVVLFGLNSKFTGRLSIQFQERRVKKIYIAVLEGLLPVDAGELIDELSDEEPPSRDDSETVVLKICQLSFTVLQRFQNRTQVAIMLGTGRRNQIRRQFAKAGFPIVGDLKFGATEPFPDFATTPPLFQPIALHASRLEFYHPKSMELMKIEAPLPPYWLKLLPDSEA